MKRDLLAEATCALRESAEAPPAPVNETRARVMTTLRKERARRVPLVRMLIPLAAVLVGSMAWAASMGRLPTSFREVVPGFAKEPEAPPSLSVPPSSAPPSSAPSSAPTAPLETEEKALEAPPEREAMDAPNGAPPRVAAKPIGALTPEPRAGRSIPPPTVTTTPTAPPAEKPATTPSEPDEQALYSAAHRYHFVERNPGAALAAWDTYLRAAPRGRLAVEAHYNRALCLVRLGRAAEAEAALEGFARGAYGGYRRAEARTLLDAMRGASP
jgi:hypothetical protein